MKTLYVVYLILIPVYCFSQYCKYNKTPFFEEINHSIYTEHAGIFPNAMFVPKNQSQIELNGLPGTLVNYYEKAIYGAIFQVRYGLRKSTELLEGISYMYPQELNPEYGYDRQLVFGFKQRLFRIFPRKMAIDLALTTKGIAQESVIDDNPLRTGISIGVDLSCTFFRFIQTDLSLGGHHFPYGMDYTPFVSGMLYMKNRDSKVGLFVGYSHNIFIENYTLLGLEHTDNQNYIACLSFGLFDEAVTPNLSYTHLFQSRTNHSMTRRKHRN